jgi:hypothetical protein
MPPKCCPAFHFLTNIPSSSAYLEYTPSFYLRHPAARTLDVVDPPARCLALRVMTRRRVAYRHPHTIKPARKYFNHFDRLDRASPVASIASIARPPSNALPSDDCLPSLPHHCPQRINGAFLRSPKRAAPPRQKKPKSHRDPRTFILRRERTSSVYNT